MRGRNAVGVALRHPDGSIVAGSEPLNSILHRNRFARAPFFRGLVVLYETLVIGTKLADAGGFGPGVGQGEEMGRGTIALTLIVTIGLAIGLFVLAAAVPGRRHDARRRWALTRRSLRTWSKA